MSLDPNIYKGLMGTIKNGVYDFLLELERIHWVDYYLSLIGPKKNLEAVPLERSLEYYEGIYSHPGYGDIVVWKEGDRLKMQYYRITGNLIYQGKDRFTPEKNIDDSMLYGLEFQFREKGLEARIEPALPPVFFQASV